MRRRFHVRDGMLVDRDGRVLGRLVSVTLDIDPLIGSVLDDQPAAEPTLFAEEKGGTTGGDEVLSQTADSGLSGVAVTPNERDGGLGEGGDPNGSAADAPIEEVWAEYVEVMAPRRTELDPQSRAIIRDALKVATVDECKLAIRACKASAFHMGQNDRRRKYNKLAQILKARRGHNETTRDRIDWFLDLAAKSGVESHVSSGGRVKVSQAKREVLGAWEFPGDEVVVKRGEEAARWLRAHGWGIDYGDDRRPSFRPPVI